MEIRSILVNIDIGKPNSPSLAYAIDLARSFNAELIGFAADQPNLAYLGIDSSGAAIEVYTAERQTVEAQITGAEIAFKAAVPSSIQQRWLAYIAPQTQALLDCAHLADIIVTPSTVTNALGDTQKVALGELALGAGRPILNVGAAATLAACDKVVIGWKNTREARRAVADALPFLQRAKDVLALTVSEGDEVAERKGLADLAAWLAGHGVTARTELLHDTGRLGDLLQVTAADQKADLLVSGAYGHTRMREWLFGGVTRGVLEANGLNRLLSN